MPDRTPISPLVEAQILLTSARRCCFCYGLDGDLRRKKGQIAHIDHDRSNSREENLAYLCMDHHDEFDSKTSQAKGLTESELREYKKRLLGAIERGDHHKLEKPERTSDERAAAIRGHDERLFREADALMPEMLLRKVFGNLGG